MPFKINVVDLNSQAIESILDDVLYYLILNWNQSGGYWTLGIRNSGYQTVIDRICMSVNFDLLKQFKYSDIPPGVIVVETLDYRSGPIPRDGFVSGKYVLSYYTEQEVMLLNAV